MTTIDELIIRMRAVGGGAAASEVKGVGSEIEGMAGTARKAAGVAGLAGLAFGLKDITQAAMRFQTQTNQLANALKNTGQYSAASIQQTVEYADKLATHGGLNPADTITGVTSLVRAHDTLKQAMHDQLLVTDIVRGKQVSYTAALRAVQVVEQGRTTGLARLGIVIKPITAAQDALANSTQKVTYHQERNAKGIEVWVKGHDKVTTAMRRVAKEQDQQATKTEALRVLWQRFGGATEAYSKGAEGAVSNFRNSIDVLAQRVGTVLLPVVDTLAHFLTHVADAIAAVVGKLGENNKVMKIVRDVIFGLIGAWVAYRAALIVAAAANAIMAAGWALFVTMASGALVAVEALGTAIGILTSPITLVLIALGVLIYEVVTHFKAIKAAFMDVINWIGAHWKLILTFLLPVVGLIVTHFGDIKNAAKSVVDWVVNAFHNMVHFVAGLPHLISAAASGLWDGLKAGLTDVINWIIDRFNGIPFIHGFHVGPLHVPGIPKIHHLQGLAEGGFVTRGGAFMVGEQGPEPVFLPAGAAVQPAQPPVANVGHPQMVIPDQTIYVMVDNQVLARAVSRGNQRKAAVS